MANLLLLLMLSVNLTACGYTVGNSYQPDVQTVYVPIFENKTFRRGYEYQLTEAVQRKIQSRTPFRIAKGVEADTRLTGTIRKINKSVLGTTQNNDPRNLNLQFVVDVTWEDMRSGRILSQQQVPINADVVQLVSQASFAPEVGQSLATATQRATDELANQIVQLMEAPW
ncbi:LPS assembly lipoprotein LptE [Gimesia panareensis]|uniref:LPS assembly lipoprotein LptE n=1 Tax=Gimesia panareensis TaxID=2527978 RepID=UPI001E547440|nr:LPS assembly lipoprotein LptE [Gimesia panareensis]